MELLRRKIDDKLLAWKLDPEHKPLIVKGARQIGKTESIRKFAGQNFENVIEINFALQKQYRDIFDSGFEVDSILNAVSFHNPELVFTPGKTLFFFDELQACPNCATSLKSFHLDKRFDVICSGSLMGISYKQIESNSVGFKEDIEMYSMDFEEFLWAKSYRPEQIDKLYQHMLSIEPLSPAEMSALTEVFREYMTVGGMPEIVNTFVKQKNYSGILKMQRQILLDYEEDITKYADGMDQTRILNVYRKIPVFLGKENKKFQISKVAPGARSRDYIGTVEWLENAGIVNRAYCLSQPELPLKGNYEPDSFKLFYADTGLLIASLDDEAQEDLRNNRNFNTYKGALYENIMSEILRKQGYPLFYWKNEKGTIEIDFFVRDRDSLIPLEVKANNGTALSMNKLIGKESFADVQYGIKFAHKNIGYNGKFYTFPYFLSFLLKKYLREKAQR